MSQELPFNVPEDQQEFFQENKKTVEAIHVLQMMSKLNPNDVVSKKVLEHPRDLIAIMLNIQQDIDSLHKYFAEVVKPEFREIYTRENIMAATLAGMMLVALDQEHNLLNEFDALATAMMDAINLEQPTMH